MTDNKIEAGVICPACGAPNFATSNFCENCGSALHGTTFSATARDGTEPVSRHRVAETTDIGYSHHVNQDAGGAWSWNRAGNVPASLLVVADGVSAGKHSEGASTLAVELIQTRLAPLLADASEDLDHLLAQLLTAAKQANQRVAQRPHESLSNADATTLVAAAAIGGQGVGVWCGDSRVYALSGGRAHRLTRDHSWAEAVVSRGMMSEEQAASDPRAHMITRWLGPPPQDDPGLEVFRFGVNPGDVVLCCTDGLYMYFAAPESTEDEMAAVVEAAGEDLAGGLDRLIKLALSRGGKDNITAAALRVD